MVTDTVLVSGVLATVLIDSGSMHSFVSKIFVKRLGITPNMLMTQYSMTVP